MDFRIDFYCLHQDFEDTQRYTSASKRLHF